MKKFLPLTVNSSFFTCSVPLNLDSYRQCYYGCEYCFMKNRIIGKSIFQQPNILWLKNKFKKIYDDNNINSSNFMEVLLKNNIDLHCGTKSDPFQPKEAKYGYTEKIVNVCNDYGRHIIFTTKSDTYHNVKVTPDKHSFQLSITNNYNDKFLEPNVPSLNERIEFYRKLKDEGFNVGLRIAPYIPNITNISEIVELFEDLDYVFISNLRLSPQKDNHKLFNYIGANNTDYITKGNTIMKKEILYQYLKKDFDYLDEHGYKWSCRYLSLGNNKCCCGDNLINKCTEWDTLHLKFKYRRNWSIEEGLSVIGEYKQCNCYNLYTSNRRNGNKTIEDFYRNKWNGRNCIFNPENQFKIPPSLNMYF